MGAKFAKPFCHTPRISVGSGHNGNRCIRARNRAPIRLGSGLPRPKVKSILSSPFHCSTWRLLVLLREINPDFFRQQSWCGKKATVIQKCQPGPGGGQDWFAQLGLQLGPIRDAGPGIRGWCVQMSKRHLPDASKASKTGRKMIESGRVPTDDSLSLAESQR